MNEHIKYVIKHDGLFPGIGFGGCSCPTCDAIRKHLEYKLQDNLSLFPRNKRGSQTSYGQLFTGANYAKEGEEVVRGRNEEASGRG